jgi:outer membrane protein assembly factor BamE (lipoprotein component of BamABCDE complex)
MTRLALSILVGLGALTLLAGCHRQFTHDRFDMIQIGADDREDVRNILGKPTSDLNDQWLYDDLKHHYSAVVYFDADGRVTGREWMNAKTGEWEGRNPNADEPPQGEVHEQHKNTTRIDKD